MDRNSRFVFYLVGLAASAIILAMILTLQNPPTPPSEQVIAVAIPLTGEASFYKKSSSQAQPLKESEDLSDLDSLETQLEQTALLRFQDGYEIELGPKTFVTFESTPEAPVLKLKYGKIKLLVAGHRGSLLIDDGKQEQEAYTYFTNLFATQTARGENPDILPPLPDTASVDSLGETLTGGYIRSLLQSQHKNFQRCFTQLLQKQPAAKVQANIFFRIERNGRVTNIKVMQSDLTDTQFENCLSEVVNRVVFKAFRGEPIDTSFPLLFE